MNQTWNVTTKRCVAFLDIMGFKDMVARSSHDTIYKRLQSISKSQNAIEEAKFLNVYMTKFSDSIAIFSKDDTKDSLMAFMVATEFVFTKCIIDGIPIKGAMAYGKISVDIENSLFFGQPIIDAYQLEEDLKYYGIILHHTMFNVLNKRGLGSVNIKHIETPLKCGNIFHYNLDWFTSYNKLADEKKDSKIIEFIEQYYNKVSGAPRKYIDNTIGVYRKFYPEQ